jgi:CRISPR-associated endonuclease/helicase Cas3
LITQKDLYEKKANEIIKVEKILEDDFDTILDRFNSGKNILRSPML